MGVPAVGKDIHVALCRLVEDWEKRLRARNNISWNAMDSARGLQLQECFDELQEALKCT